VAIRVLFASAIAIAAALPASAQTSGSFSGTASFSGPMFALPTVTGAAYSGEEVSENIKVLTDGTKISQKMSGRKIWRDLEGRTRTERRLGPDRPSSPTIVEITDPVAGYKYTLDPQAKVAHRQKWASRPVTAAPPGFGGGGAVGMAPPPMLPKSTHESLGSQSMDGVIVEGMRNITTFPAGMMGNDREFSVVTETWTSPELKLGILSKTNDPRNGESMFRIQNLSRMLPDPMLFTVPSDYRVVDEGGSFTIEFKGQ
jgi:hypothetical protein